MRLGVLERGIQDRPEFEHVIWVNKLEHVLPDGFVDLTGGQAAPSGVGKTNHAARVRLDDAIVDAFNHATVLLFAVTDLRVKTRAFKCQPNMLGDRR